VARILEALRNSRAKARFYQASTSELFGNAKISPQDEETPFHPRSPYAIAKLYGHHITVNYREAYGLHTSCGILFNHESPLRPAQFITRKVTLAFARMAAGQSVTLQVGNLDAARDWGFAGDYVEGMWRMVQQPAGDDFVLATGVAHTVRQLIETAASCVNLAIEWRGSGSAAEGIERKSGRVLVKIDPAFYRPADITQTVGNPAKAARELGWRAALNFEKLIAMMIEADIARIAAGGALA
jgi:GDPmannose 4,6-dehydratase